MILRSLPAILWLQVCLFPVVSSELTAWELKASSAPYVANYSSTSSKLTTPLTVTHMAVANRNLCEMPVAGRRSPVALGLKPRSGELLSSAAESLAASSQVWRLSIPFEGSGPGANVLPPLPCDDSTSPGAFLVLLLSGSFSHISKSRLMSAA